MFNEIHSSNSARPPDSKVLIPLDVPQSLNLVLSELKDRQKCEALPNGLVIESMNITQLNFMRARKESLEMIEHMID